MWLALFCFVRFFRFLASMSDDDCIRQHEIKASLRIPFPKNYAKEEKPWPQLNSEAPSEMMDY
jgi:hypothetical protein